VIHVHVTAFAGLTECGEFLLVQSISF